MAHYCIILVLTLSFYCGFAYLKFSLARPIILPVFLVLVLTTEHENALYFVDWRWKKWLLHELFWRKHSPQNFQEVDPGDPLLSSLPGTLFQNHHSCCLWRLSVAKSSSHEYFFSKYLCNAEPGMLYFTYRENWSFGK